MFSWIILKREFVSKDNPVFAQQRLLTGEFHELLAERLTFATRIGSMTWEAELLKEYWGCRFLN